MSTPVFRSLSRNLTAVPQTIDISADFISCTAAAEEFLVSFDDQAPVVMRAGYTYKMPSSILVQKVTLSQKAGALVPTNAVELTVGQGELMDLRFNFSGNVNMTPNTVFQTRAATLVNADDVTLGAGTTVLSAGSADQAGVGIQNVGAVSVRIGSTVSATKGFVLEPNGYRFVASKTQIDAYAGSAGAKVIVELFRYL
jgi:hypothetical protein